MPIWTAKTSLLDGGLAAEARDTSSLPALGLVQPEMVPRQCRLAGYLPRQISPVVVRSDIIAYASPDSTYAVTKQLFDEAKRSILIGIYDFTAPHMKQLVLDALARGVRVALMLDIDGADEDKLFDELVDVGVEGVSAPSCANKNIHLFASSHEKVIVIDDEWTLVQSGNYSANSIPLNEADGLAGPQFRTGNRDAGLAVRSRPLAKLFTGILRSDMQASTDAPAVAQPEAEAAQATQVLLERAPSKRPSKLFPSKHFQLDAGLRVQPVLSPDNYMSVVPPLIAAATTSIDIEQQYIKAHQPEVRTLLEAIASARSARPGLKVRIILGRVFSRADLDAEHRNLKLLADDFALKLGTHIRYINTDRLVHCHNKMIVVDDAKVLVSSQNWSDFAVTKNREAGLWVPHSGIAQYFGAVFDTDWGTAFKTPDQIFAGPGATPESLAPEALGAGGFIKVEPGDYQEV
jgi:phosphatidylserine/phosphatidylglycerophosphate/cardiolipin synthase-like enzyme